MATTTTNLGVVTAYGDAVAAGYTGTKAEWQALMASYATVAETAQGYAEDAQGYASNASTYATNANNAKIAAQGAQTAAETAQGHAEDAQEAAESARDTVQASASQIAQNTSDISQLNSDISDINADITELNADIDDIKKVLGGEITLDDLTTANYFIDTDGSLTGTTLSISSSEMYPTIGLDKLHIVRSPRLASAWSIAFYTDSVFSADNFISGWVYNGVTEDLDVTIPASANYVAFCSRTNEGNFIVDMVFSDVLEQTQNNTSELNEILLSHKGEYISFLGDSITSYLHYNPVDNAAFYPVSWFSGVERTWWYKLIQATQMELLINNSSSGSHMATTATLSGLSRCENLDDGTHTPDHVIVFMGVNDFVNGNGVVGECGQNQSTYSVDNFSDAYYTALYNIKVKYPNARLYLGTIMQFAKDDATFPNTKHNVALTVFNEAIRKLAEIFGAKVIEFNKCGIDFFNNATTLGDELHPNYVGHDLMYKEALKAFIH